MRINWKISSLSEDKEKYEVITKEVLESYGEGEIYLKKATKTHKDEKGIDRDV